MQNILMAFFMFTPILIVISKLIKLNITPIIFIILIFLSIRKIKIKKFILKINFLLILISAIFFSEITKLNLVYKDFFEIIINLVLGVIVTSFQYNFKQLKPILKFCAYLNIIVVSIYVFFNYHDIRGSELGYMNIGYYYMLSSLYLTFSTENFKIKKELIIIIVTILLQFLYGNRFSAVISCIYLIFNIFKKLNNFFRIFLVIICFFICYYSKFVLEKLIINFQIKTIGILRMHYTLDNINVISKILSGRDEIYLNILEVIKKNILGTGVYGYLDYTNYPIGFYPHNIFLEIMLQFGIIGIVSFIAFSVYSYFYYLKIKIEEKKKFYELIIFYNIILLISGTYLKHRFFIFFIFLILTPNFIKYKTEISPRFKKYKMESI